MDNEGIVKKRNKPKKLNGLEILKKATNLTIDEYIFLKKELKILNCYRNYTTLYSRCCDINVSGDFFIHDDCENFEYFVKNEYLARNEK